MMVKITAPFIFDVSFVELRVGVITHPILEKLARPTLKADIALILNQTYDNILGHGWAIQ